MALQYSSGQGDPTLREQICEVMALEGISAHPDDVVVTVGSQQAVDLVTRIFCDPGDVVICEAPSYVGALGVFKAFQCQVVHAEMDADGLVPDALRQAIAVTRAAGKTIKFLYTIPNFHNPAGVTMSLARRAEILDICRSEGVLVLEDNPYGLLGFDSEPMRALRADEAEGVVYLGSFSKTFSPGMRVGWALAPHAVREKLVLAQESATLCPPAFNQMAVSAYLAQHDWQGQIKQMREMYRERRDAMIEALQDFMPAACQWNVPHGGFFVWMTLPPGIDAKAMLPARGHGPGRVRAGHGVLRRRLRRRLDAAVVLLPHARADPRGRTPPGRRPRGGDGAARDVRRRPRPPTCPAAGTTAPERTSHDAADGIPSSCWPAASPTSATSRCGRAAVRPRRCGPPASRWPSATSTPACSPPCSPTRPRAWSRCCTARAARTAPSARSSTCWASRTSAPGRPPAAPRSTSRSPSPWSPASASPRPRACACRTRRSASSARPR